MSKYTKELIARAAGVVEELNRAVAECPLLAVKELWRAAVENGCDTVDENFRLRKERGMPEGTTGRELEAVCTLETLEMLLDEATADRRAVQWFIRRGGYSVL